MTTAEVIRGSTRSLSSTPARFACLMAGVLALMVAVSIEGAILTYIRTPVFSRCLVAVVVVAILLPIPAYWHEKQNQRRRDAASLLPWAALITLPLPFPSLIAARLRMPLQDRPLA